MHCLYFVLLPSDTKLEDASTDATQTLTDNDFVSEGGYFNSSKSDWFVIGGRWSGEFSLVRGKHIGDRDQYQSDGYMDDAIRLTTKFIEKLKNKWPTVEIFDSVDYCELIVSDLTKKDIGKILVVVDYHS